MKISDKSSRKIVKRQGLQNQPFLYTKILTDFKSLIIATNYHRSKNIRSQVHELIANIDSYLFSGQLHPYILIILEYYVLLADYGTEKSLSKEKKALTYNYPKIWLNSSAVSADEGGLYKNKFGVHISHNKFDTVIHEIVHFLANHVYSEYQPMLEKAVNLLQQDLKNIKNKPDEFISLEEYSSEEIGDELLSVTTEYLLHYGQMPGIKQGYHSSSKLIDELFNNFIENINRELIIKKIQIAVLKPVSKLELYRNISSIDKIPDNKNLHPFLKTNRNMGFYPLHITASLGFTHLLNWLLLNNDIGDCDKFGNLPLHCALGSEQKAASELLLEFTDFKLITNSKNENMQSTLNLIHYSGGKYKLNETYKFFSALFIFADNPIKIGIIANYITDIIKKIDDHNKLMQIVSYVRYRSIIFKEHKPRLQKIEQAIQNRLESPDQPAERLVKKMRLKR